IRVHARGDMGACARCADEPLRHEQAKCRAQVDPRCVAQAVQESMELLPEFRHCTICFIQVNNFVRADERSCAQLQCALASLRYAVHDERSTSHDRREQQPSARGAAHA
ncbi:MAG: hypothetical protein ACK559_12760, partial [bacterium]